jgi:hypothetical protein
MYEYHRYTTVYSGPRLRPFHVSVDCGPPWNCCVAVWYYPVALKGRNFLPLFFFSSNNHIWAPDPRDKAFSNMALNLKSYSTKSVPHRYQWHRWGQNHRFQSRISSRIPSHLQKGFKPCIRGPGEVVLLKNQRPKISWHCPFNGFFVTGDYTVLKNSVFMRKKTCLGTNLSLR